MRVMPAVEQVSKQLIYKLFVFTEMGTFQNLVTAVALIIEEYMADMFHVNTNLMGTSRFKNAFYKSDIAQTLQNPVMGHGMLSLIIGQNGHLHAVSGIPANVSGDGSLVLFNGSPHQGTVASFGGLLKNCIPRLVLASGVLAMTSSPEVSLSMR